MVVSTGMQSMETIRRVYKTVREHNQNFTLLQCTSAYPLDPKDVNLSVIKEYQKEFPDIPIGYSGHEQGIYITVAAVAMGAKVVERHVTLDKTWKGNDHEASLEPSGLAELVRAIRLVEMAKGSPVKQMLPCEKNCHDKDCGADCAKFQKSELEHKFNKRALERPYTSKHSWGKTYGEHKRHLEFSHEQYRELQKYAEEVGIFFTASGMDEMAVEFLHELDVPFLKVGSGDTNNFPYLEKTAKKGRPMVVSSGMQSMETMRRVYKTVKEHNQNFTILQCTSAYPLEAEDVNLRVIAEYQKEFPDIPIGYSGHESGINISVAAVALGAKVIERHVTLDKTWKGSDHAASLEPAELTELVRSIRLVERALGSSLKQMLPCEKPCHDKLGKSVVAKVKIPKGTALTLDMLTVKVAEPMGVAAEDIFQLVGKTVTEDVEEDESVAPGLVDSYGKRAKC
uniref:N-acetylneuraminate-9-phosphate synthase n=1 Tax=Scophthalmus maximus TaxID=52904 RepID=A0A8D3B9L2_SCOMX